MEVRRGVETGDVALVVSAGAAALRRQVDRLESDGHVGNIIPTAKSVLPQIREYLVRIEASDYDDGVVVSLGIELNAFQWHVNALQENIGDSTKGELVGLFATAHLFLARFEIWTSYTGTVNEAGVEGGVAEFKLARKLLERARAQKTVLSVDADQRVETILNRAPNEETAEDIREGVIRSGENLAAVTLNSLGAIVTEEAKAVGTSVRSKAREAFGKAVIDYVSQNAVEIGKLATLRMWPWATWALMSLKSVVGN